MRVISFNLRDTETEYGFMPHLDVYLLDKFWDAKRPMVVICPGGGYENVCADREGERIALSYNAAGFHAAIVNYSTRPHRQPNPINEVAEAIRIVRSHAEEWQLMPDKIAVCGFSAGGHLAASISTLWNDPDLFSAEEIESRLHRPDATILGYPVISGGENGHKNSFRSLIGEDQNDPLWQKYSLENAVDDDTPPAFIWHTCEDSEVPMENSMMYASSLRKHKIPFELHIYPKGCHGMVLVSDEYIWSKTLFRRDYMWMKLSVDWLNELFGL